MDEETKAAHEAKWHTFVDRVNTALDEVFDFEAEHPVIVMGMQFGEMENPVVTSNLPICLTEDAVLDMVDVARAAHAHYHGVAEDGEPLGFPMDEADIPEEVRAAALAAAEAAGIPPEMIRYIQVPDTSDLDDPQGALNIPLPGDPTTVEGTD